MMMRLGCGRDRNQKFSSQACGISSIVTSLTLEFFKNMSEVSLLLLFQQLFIVTSRAFHRFSPLSSTDAEQTHE